MQEDIKAILDRYSRNEAFLVPILQDIQSQFNYLSKQVLLEVAEELGISHSHIFSVATFYKAFSLNPRGKHILSLCLGTACHVRGAPKILEKVERTLGVKPGQTTKDGQCTLETVNCLGACALGPIMVADDEYHGQMTLGKVDKVIGSLEKGERS